MMQRTILVTRARFVYSVTVATVGWRSVAASISSRRSMTRHALVRITDHKNHFPTVLPSAETKFLLYTQKQEIRGLDLLRPNYNVIAALTTPVVNDPYEIDFDNSEQWLYWLEDDIKPPSEHGIRRGTLNGSHVETIIDSGLSSPVMTSLIVH